MEHIENFRNKIVFVIKKLIKYNDLGFVLNHIEDLISLPIPYKNPNSSSEQFDYNKNLAIQTIKQAEQAYNELVNELNNRKNCFDYVKSINPDFCENMKNKIPDKDYEEYIYMLKKCCKDLSNLIYYFKDEKNNYDELLLGKKDAVSNIIDAQDTSKLAYIQDMFVLQEIESIEVLDNINPQIISNISNIKEQLNSRISRYKTFEKLYSSKNIIKLKIDNKER